ncbi:GDP-mannose transporter into the lumen of the Golgi [Irineochytrium annulatum]|nr:GDP-mannose transporter into the lumen of the Golgi [Irineochytrium annulatum]
MIYLFTSLNLITNLRPYTHADAIRWFPVSIAMVAMIYTGSKAIQSMAIPLLTVFKNLTIILIAFGERTWFGGSAVEPLTLLSFVLMVLSSVIAGWSDLSQGKVVKGASSAFEAYVWMVANCLTSAFFVLFMRARIKDVGFKDFDTVYYNNLLSVPVLMLCSFVVEGPELGRTRERYFGDEEAGGWTAMAGLLAALAVSSVSAFAISYGSAWCVRVTSSTTYSMTGALNKLPIAVAGMLLFDDPVTAFGVFGVLLAFGADPSLGKHGLLKDPEVTLPESELGGGSEKFAKKFASFIN